MRQELFSAAFCFIVIVSEFFLLVLESSSDLFILFGSVVKRLRHRPFTAVTRVRFPSESLRSRVCDFGSLAQLVRATGS